MRPNGNILLKRVPTQKLKFVCQHELLMSMIANIIKKLSKKEKKKYYSKMFENIASCFSLNKIDFIKISSSVCKENF